MTHQPHNDLDLDPPQTTLPRRRVFQSLVGATLAVAGLTGCGGGSEEEDEDNEAGAEDEEGNEQETGGDQEADD